MKIAVVNFSGNVGKSTIARHLLMPRITGAELIAVESLNADEGQGQALRGREFGALQEYLQTISNAVVDIGASNVEELMALMHKYRGSHEDFDYFVVPTVPALKQQQDTIATLAELMQLGVRADKVRLVFNMVDDGASVAQVFGTLLAYNSQRRAAMADLDCRLSTNEVYQRIKATGFDLASLAADDTDYKAKIAGATDMPAKLTLAQKLATRRLALGVLPELDACFAALHLESASVSATRATQRKNA